ncbi:molecular chaperone GrpE [Arcanobacterium wilhelmae]|uniref:Protein GrpE n=1 Tax=Arcanobacterium wilhelmae TaxID=1803177 RepID=A0ABT9NAG1_9ACTO|nr:nucleotide exchange factor GrpE [Arcanobacterium wilhelmae]MDP9800708.1 molecular chaperone GrpE [Arcanobacterium wilhelmae]WFN90107.1 nucleotide exchange factor GrpE [Arcanobacterium wilhelmae]
MSTGDFTPNEANNEEPLNPNAQNAEGANETSAPASSEGAEQAGVEQANETGATEPGEDATEAAGGEPAADELSPLDTALLRVTELEVKVADLEDKLARANASEYNLRQEYNGYVKRSKAEGMSRYESGQAKVIEALLSVLDDAALARQHGDLEGPSALIVDKLENMLKTNFKVERFGAEGDPFDPELHEALMHSTSAEVEAEQVAQLIQPGYKMGEKLLRAARVGVVSPE